MDIGHFWNFKFLGLNWGQLLKIAGYLSPAPSIGMMVLEGSSQGFSYYGILLSLLVSCLGVWYGLIVDDRIFAYVHGFGLLIYLIYMCVFICLSTPARRLKASTCIFFVALIVGEAVGLSRYSLSPYGRRAICGTLLCFFSTASYMYPLHCLKNEIKTADLHKYRMAKQFFIALFGFTVTVHVVMSHDYFLVIPDSIGLAYATTYILWNVWLIGSNTCSFLMELYELLRTHPAQVRVVVEEV